MPPRRSWSRTPQTSTTRSSVVVTDNSPNVLHWQCPVDSASVRSFSKAHGHSQVGRRDGSATVFALILRIHQFHNLAIELLHFSVLFGGVEGVHRGPIES